MGNVGFLGMGVMGSRMTARLLAAGHQVTVWNRTPEKCGPLCEKGAIAAATPAEAATGRDVVLCNLTDGPALKSRVLGPGGVLEADPLPKLVVDFATISPAESAEIGAILGARGVAFLRAPVSGTAFVAESGKLTIIASGDKAAYEAATPYLDVIGQTRYYVGEGEAARYLKLIHQIMIGATMQVWAEGLVMGEKAGLDWDTMLEVLGHSAVGSQVVTGKIPSLSVRSYDKPAMNMHNIVKDLDLALSAAEGVDVRLPATECIRKLYDAAMAEGYEWKDYSALVLHLEKAAGLEPKESRGTEQQPSLNRGGSN
jgi:3-hydroxyisobutyrate dehydrogenase